MKEPPRLARHLLRRTLPDPVRDFLIGDLVERYQTYARLSPIRARVWFWRQTLGAIVAPLPGAAGVELRGGLFALSTDAFTAGRGLVRRPGQSVVAVLTLGLGIGVVGTAFSILNGTVLKGLPFEEADRLIHFERANPELGRPSMAVTPHDFDAWRATQSSFEGLGAFVEAATVLPTDGAPPERQLGVRISTNSFELLRIEPALGRLFSPEEGRVGATEVVLLSHFLWKGRFGGDPSIVGRQIRMNDTPTTVVGIMPEGFGFPIAERFWLPLRIDLESTARGEGRLDVFGRLSEGTDLEAAVAEFERISERLADAYPGTNGGVVAVLRSFHDEYVGEEFTRTTVRMLLAAILVLLVSCANVANLLLIHGTRRRPALVLRIALGATRLRIARQMLLEAGALAIAGAALGVMLAWYGVEWFDRVGAQAGVFSLPHGSESLFWWDVGLDASTLGFVIAVTSIAALLAGGVPALRVSGSAAGGAQTVRSGAGSVGSGRGWLAEGLVVTQLTLTTGLLVFAGLVTRSALNVAGADDAISTENVFVTRVDLPFDGGAYEDEAARLALAERLVSGLSQRPQLTEATIGTSLPLVTPHSAQFEVDRAGEVDSNLEVGIVSVTANYFATFRVTTLEGRVFDGGDREGASPVALVNRSFAQRYLADGAVLGARVRLGPEDTVEPWVTVVGIVPDLWDRPLTPHRESGVYLPLAQGGIGDPAIRLGRLGLRNQNLVVRARRGASGVADDVRQFVFGVDGSLPVRSLRSMDEVVRQQMGRYRVWGSFYLAFAIAALLLASVGIYGVLTFNVTHRTPEIGVRRALGASRASVQVAVMRSAGRSVALGGALGLAIGAILADGLSRVLYGVDTGDPAVFATVVGVVTLVSLLASWLPARRAAAIDPVEAMRFQ